MILDNHRITIRESADNVGITFGSCQAIFVDVLGNCIKRQRRMFKKLKNFKQKQRCMDITEEMLTRFNDGLDLLNRDIPSDESWVYGYDIEIKAQSSQWNRPEVPRPKKACLVRLKVFLTVFFDYNGMVHHEFLPQGHAVNKKYYLKLMSQFR